MATVKTNAVPLYRGKPLIRSGNGLYYGDPSQKYIASLQVLSTKPFQDLMLSDKISVQILSTDEALHTSQRVLKRIEKNGLYNALAIASIWLDRALAK